MSALGVVRDTIFEPPRVATPRSHQAHVIMIFKLSLPSGLPLNYVNKQSVCTSEETWIEKL